MLKQLKDKMYIPIIDLNNLSKFRQYRFILMFSFLLGASFFLPYVIQDGGPFLFYGDYTVQQIPFYQEAHRAVLSGDIFWSWNTDLGANFIGSYSFYLLGSPFFWLTLPFPNHLMAAVLPWLLCLKFSLATLFGFMFIKRFVKNINYAFIGALLYSFSGYSIYNIFFNHFHEMIVLFPLLLIGIEELLENDRRGVFAVAVAFNALCNYYFFIGEVVFLILYFFMRVLNGSWKKLDGKRLLVLYFEAVLGVAAAAVLLFPSFLAVTQIPRSSSKLNGWGLLLYGEIQLYPNLLASFFLPPELPAKPAFFNNIGPKWSSMAAFLPLFSLTGVLAWLKRRSKGWIGKLIILLFVFTFVPVLNSSFQLFSNSFYTRWFYMFVLMLSLCTAIAFDRLTDKQLYKGYILTAFITMAVALPVGLIQNPDTKMIGLVPKEFIDRYWVNICILVICLLLSYMLIKIVKRKNEKFLSYSLISLFFVISVIGNVYMLYGRSYGYDAKDFNPKNINARGRIDLPNLQNVRSDVLDGMDNQALFWQIPTIQAFHSIVPGTVTDFYESVGVERGVASRPEPSHIWLRSLLSVKYLFDDDNREDINTFGWKKLDKQNGFTIWENTNYVPFGFTYENYVTKKQFENTDKNSREKLLLNAIYLNDEQISKYGGLLTQMDDDKVGYFSDEEMVNACNERRKSTVNDFKRDSRGFEGNITLNKSNLVFFSVPFEEGWTATVNGQSVKIEKVNSGFMAILCPSGTSNIRFNYFTPGLLYGLLISLGAILLFAGYMYFNKRSEK